MNSENSKVLNTVGSMTTAFHQKNINDVLNEAALINSTHNILMN